MKVLEQYLIASRLICNNPNGATVKELSEALHISERAVFNLKNQLEEILPIMVVSDPDDKRLVRYKAKSSNVMLHLPEMELSDFEKAYMQYLRKKNTADVPGNINERFFNKIGIMFAQRGTYTEMQNEPIVFLRNPRCVTDRRHSDQNLEFLLDCINRKLWVKIITDAGGSETVVKLFPVLILVSDDGSYLYAVSTKDTLLCIDLVYIKNVGKGFKGIEPKLKPDIQSIISDPFGADWDTDPLSVELELSGKTAETEPLKQWPKSVVFKNLPDGKVRMTARTHSLRGCEKWILGRTPDVKVISPEELRIRITEAYEKGKQMHQR